MEPLLTASSLHIMHEPGHISRVIVKEHHALIALKEKPFSLRMYAHQCWLYPSRATHSISHGTLQKIPPSTLLFQPLPLGAKAHYCGYCFVLEPQSGMTFGALLGRLQDLRARCQKTIDKLVKRPCTPGRRSMTKLDRMQASKDLVTCILCDGEVLYQTELTTISVDKALS